MSYLCPSFVVAARNAYYRTPEPYALCNGGKGAVLEVSLRNSDKRELQWFPVSVIINQLTEPGLPDDATQVFKLALREIIRADLESYPDNQKDALGRNWKGFLAFKEITLDHDI
ncbi:MAG: hypothetical protein LRY54_03280 [Alphaproteobacteria bacterium]|nr:hypothetical protein [Alphaproteobacteria bacterium]